MIEVLYQARLGNNLFQYCLGRILAEELGFTLKAEPLRGFPNTSAEVRGRSYDAPDEILTGQSIDLVSVLEDRRPRKILLKGWFQRHEYYRPYRARIRQWLAFDPSVSGPRAMPDVVVHVRRMDYVDLGWALPFSYYAEALDRLLPRGGTVSIVTDDIQDPFLRRFEPWRPSIQAGEALEQMLVMVRARRLIMSQSTFSWWPAFLGDLEEVACPVPSFGIWSDERGSAGTNLIERDRFVCIDCPQPYHPTVSEALYQKWRRWRRRVTRALNTRLDRGLLEPAR